MDIFFLYTYTSDMMDRIPELSIGISYYTGFGYNSLRRVSLPIYLVSILSFELDSFPLCVLFSVLLSLTDIGLDVFVFHNRTLIWTHSNCQYIKPLHTTDSQNMNSEETFSFCLLIVILQNGIKNQYMFTKKFAYTIIVIVLMGDFVPNPYHSSLHKYL